MPILTGTGRVRGAAAQTRAATARQNKPAAGMKSLLDTPAAAGILTSLVVISLMLGLRAWGMLQPLELMAYDRMVLLRADQSGTVRRVVQIGITEDDLNRFGWPLSDGILAAVLLRLHAAGPRAIGIDIFRPVPIGSGTPALDRALTDVPEVVWADRFSQTGWDGIGAPAAIQAADRNGFSDFAPDPGGVVRRSLLYLNDRRHQEQSFSLRLALLYLAHDRVFPLPDASGNLRLNSISLPPIQTPLGGYTDLDTRGYQIFLEFSGPTYIRSFSLADLLDGKVPDASLSNRIVLVGVTADSVKDEVTTSLSAVWERGTYGVTLQGLSAAQLVSHGLDGLAPIHALPRIWETALIVLAVMAGGCAGTVMRNAWRLAAAVAGGAALLLGAAFGCFQYGLWLPVLPLASGWIIAAVSAAAAITYAERAQKAVLMRLFSAHVSGPIAAEMWRRRNDFISHGRPIPVRLPATVLFADINGFTTISEMLEPEALVRWLSPFMDAMTSLIERHNGVIDRLAGDCVMALFGPPIVRQHLHEIETDAIEAVRYAVSMSQTLLELNRTYRAEDLPEIRVGIGIHSGELVSCCLGSAKRQQYTTIGDTANTAARLMTVAKEYMKKIGSDDVSCVALSNATRVLLGGAFNLHSLGPVMCKGKKDPIACYLLHSDGQYEPQSPRHQ
jgi:adenylate cyclase